MTLWVWTVGGIVVMVLALVIGTVLALADLALPEWEPDRDGFGDEEDEA